MRQRIQCRGLAGLLLLTSAFITTQTTRGDDLDPKSSPQPSDEATIREIGTAYVAAFNKHDSDAVAAYWSPEAVYTNKLTGERLSGRVAIAEQFARIFESDTDIKLDVTVDSIDFLSPNVAIENGSATIVSDQPEEIPYSAVYVKRDGEWLLDRVTDDPKSPVASNEDNLKGLEWMIGSWVDEDDAGAVQAECTWTKNKSFITRSFTLSVQGQPELSGLQVIGWDAGEKRIRSWTFDSDGGFAEASWSNQGDDWYVIKKGKTANGKAVSVVNVMRQLDNDTYTLKSVQRAFDGRLLPDINEVIVVRR